MLEAAIAAVAGLLIGSFLNVCIYRLPQDLSVVHPRSFCPRCERAIAWYDNIPVLSFALLRGKCRHCQAAISWRYPLVELLTAAMFFASVLIYGATVEGLKLCVFSGLLIGLIFSDLGERILPDELTWGGFAAGLILAWFVPFPEAISYIVLPLDWGERWLSVAEAVIAGGFGSFALWAMAALYMRIRGREGLGLGDVKMVAMLGSFLGLHLLLLTLVVGSLLGTLIGYPYIKMTGRDTATYELPFGSFLGIAGLVVGVFGTYIGQWYLSLWQ